ncbi:uncharacterized protein LOC117648628 [Thrips palmi]|uniref:Uncharacterized protein LOC117648628 n=1 Tax=Thrips palmi TaxID=161013 RepID=A0A6P8Z3T7_THRPL|nr:uncharacterized protein LOC117648628 [Thrips palmi]XP_034247140.1 uncharacterized protein LOC117648628 [Thrips palmi]
MDRLSPCCASLCSSDRDKPDKRDLTVILPDDVVATIFSFLHPTDLVSYVPLVCKRWYQLSKHPDAWRYADLTIVPSRLMEKASEISKSTWNLGNHLVNMTKAAPYLRTVDLSMVDSIYPCAENVVKVLLEGNTIVKNFYTFPKCTKKMQPYTMKLLQKLSPSLRSIKFSCGGGDSKKAATFFEGVNELLQIISEAPKLNYLTLDFRNLRSFQGYAGQLGQGCSALRKFELMNHQPCQDHIILDVLRNKKDQLVQVGFDSDISQDVADALKECHGLLKCRLLQKNISLVESMSQLDALEVSFIEVRTPRDIPVDCIKSSNILPHISKLTLKGSSASGFNSTLMSEVSTNTVDVLAQKCKNVVVFKLVDINLPDHLLNSLMTNFPNLQEILVDSCEGITAQHIKKLSELPSVRVVTMCDIIVKSKEAILELKTAFEALRLAKPYAVLSLSYEMSPFDILDDDSDTDGEDREYDEFGDPVFTYYDYLRNRYGDDISDMDLWALASSDED